MPAILLRYISFLSILVFSFAVTPAHAKVLGPSITFSVKTGQVYGYEHPFDQWYPASLTKLMTTYVALREVKSGRLSLKSPVRQSGNSIKKPPSKMGFPVGTILTLESALKIIMVKSANDIATAIGESVGGNEKNFAVMMNNYAKDIGMASSHFVNPHGLHDENQYTSAFDLAILARRIFLDLPEFTNLFALQAIQVGKRKYRNHNALMRHFPGTVGMKTGFICAGGLSLVTASKKADDILVTVVMGGTSGKERNVYAAELQTAARNRIQTSELGTLETLSRPAMVKKPVDISEQVCKKKRAVQQAFMYDDEAIEYFPIKALSLNEREALYLEKEPLPYKAELVKLGGASGPDPFEILVEKPPIDLTLEFAVGSQEDEPDHRFKLKNGKMVAIPTRRYVEESSAE